MLSSSLSLAFTSVTVVTSWSCVYTVTEFSTFCHLNVWYWRSKGSLASWVFHEKDKAEKVTMSLDPSRNPPAISEIVGPIDARLTDVLNAERSKWVSVDASLADPFDAC